MAQQQLYYKLNEAQNLKDSFSSWINSMAHMGNRQMGILKDIIIKPKKTFFRKPEQLRTYSVQFLFNNGKAINSYDFLVCNGLRSAYPLPKTHLTIAYKSSALKI